MSLVVAFNGQFTKLPLPEYRPDYRVDRSHKLDHILQELLRQNLSEKEFQDILESHQKRQQQSQQANKVAKHFQQPKQHIQVTRAKDIMAKSPHCLLTTDEINTAVEKIAKYRFRHFPVLENDLLVGIISDRDILLASSSQQNRQLHEVMTKQVVTAYEDTEIKQLVQVILTENIGAIPIINHQNQLTGLVTRTDLLRLLMQTPSFFLFA